MKKMIAILTALAATLSLASCSVKNDKTTADYLAEQEIEESQLIESLTQAEIERSEKMIKNIEDIGKTEKNKQIVVKVPYAYGDQYHIFVMNRKGICEKVRDYYFYETVEMFERNNEKQKEDTGKKSLSGRRY